MRETPEAGPGRFCQSAYLCGCVRHLRWHRELPRSQPLIPHAWPAADTASLLDAHGPSWSMDWAAGCLVHESPLAPPLRRQKTFSGANECPVLVAMISTHQKRRRNLPARRTLGERSENMVSENRR